jgi:DNA-binding transcriptional LysR family regulator
MRFDFTDLNLFRHIVEAGSITHGAERSNLALAAASTRIRKMELAFGTELLIRGRAGVTPTPAGRTLLQHARGILAQTERLQEDLTPFARGLAGQVRVLSNTNALTEFLPETLSSFLMAYPDISVDLEERLSDEIVGLIAEGNADIGIVAGTVDYGGLNTFPFRSDRFVLVVAKNHPLASRSRIAFSEVLDYDMVGLDRASAIQRFLADKANRIGRPLRVQRGCRYRAGNHGSAYRAHDGDQRGPPYRSVGAARADDLRARCQFTAVICASAGRSFARKR